MNDIIIITLGIMVGFLIISIIAKDIFYQKERKDLLNRIMSRDLDDYKNINGNPPSGNNKLKQRAIEEEFKNFYK